MNQISVGIIGCGNIFGAYANGCRKFNILNLVACADLDRAVAEAKAKKHSIPKVCSPEELLADPGVDVVINLTVPQVHAKLNLAALKAGKHVYTEKPFALAREEAKPVLAAAKRRKLRVGSAPDTFLGGGLQTCRKLIDEGAIGRPVAAVAFMAYHGPELFHPNPEFFYKAGGGPMFDMGPYYLTALVNLLGPVRRVTGATGISFRERVIASQPLAGKRIKVETPTHYSGALNFASGAIGTILMSFDVWDCNLPEMEIYGSEGTLSVTDPNMFGGPVRLRRPNKKEWTDIPLTHGYTDNMRGIGVADMAYAIRSGRPHRANGELAYHVLDIMQAFAESSQSGRHVLIKSTCQRPAPLPLGLAAGTLDP